MGEPAYAKGNTKNVYTPVLKSVRRLGGIEVHIVNTGESNDLDAKVEAAPYDPRNPDIALWDQAVVVFEATGVSGDVMAVCDVTAADAQASGMRHYRTSVKSSATGMDTTFQVVAQDGKE